LLNAQHLNPGVEQRSWFATSGMHMHILVVTGASGVGKTSAVRALEARGLPGVRCFYFDSIGVPAREEMRREHGDGERWQAWATQRWVHDLDQLEPAIRAAVLDGQTRPSYVAAAATTVSRSVRTVLLDCERGKRERRLEEGGDQPELITAEMAAWAAYPRGQADAYSLQVVDTSRLAPQAVADRLAEIIRQLLSPAA
jgi:broad-specificity NMP kinase